MTNSYDSEMITKGRKGGEKTQFMDINMTSIRIKAISNFKTTLVINGVQFNGIKRAKSN